MTVTTGFYRGGLEVLHPAGWLGRTTDGVLLVGSVSWLFDAADTSLVAGGFPGYELVAAGYGRATVVPSVPSWAGSRWSLPQAALIWPSLGATEDVYGVVGFTDGPDDANRVPLWAVWDTTGDPLFTCDGTTVTVTVNLGVT